MAAVTPATSVLSDWVIRPGTFCKTTEDLLKGPELKECFEFAGKALDWVPYFTENAKALATAERVSGELEPVTQGMAVLSFAAGLNGIRREAGRYFWSQDRDSRKLFNSVMGTVNAGSETAMFLDSTKIIPLGKEGLKAAAGVFWGSVGLLGGVDFFYQVGQADGLRREIEEIKDADVKAVMQNELGLTYLRIVKNVVSIALASIILVSLVFAGLSAYILFSPVVQLGLSTTWFVLHFINYYYASMVEGEKSILAKNGKKA